MNDPVCYFNKDQTYLFTLQPLKFKDTKVCNEDGEYITWYPDMFCDGKDDLANGYDEVACKGMNHLYFYQFYKVLQSI